jgi:hypothetical protein
MSTNPIVLAAMLGLTPLALVLFSKLPPRRAMLATVLVGFLFLPQAAIELPGIPNFTKTTAIVAAVLAGALFFDAGRWSAFRPAWRDAPMLVFCVAPIATSLSNDLGLWDGFSVTFDTAVAAGLPYLFGRIYFQRAEALRDVAWGLFLAGLVYAPLCLWEMRMSPHLHSELYGFRAAPFVLSLRYGGYKPTVFLEDGLMLSLFMASASLAGAWLVRRRERLFGFPLWLPVLALCATTVLCRSVGAVLLLGAGLAALASLRMLRTGVVLWLMLLFVPAYMVARASRALEAAPVVALAEMLVDEERAASLVIRLENEDRVCEKAWKRPLLGWGAWGRAQVIDEATGRQISITDGLWIILFGQRGLLGLGLFTLVLLAPVWSFFRRHRAHTWLSPPLAGASFACAYLLMHAVDSLANAKLSPVVYVSAGALTTLALVAARERARARRPAPRASDEGAGWQGTRA